MTPSDPDRDPAGQASASSHAHTGPAASGAPPGDDPRRGETRNRLLAALAPDDLAALAPHLEPIALGIGQIVAELGEAFTHVYVPDTAVVSVIARMTDGTGVEVGTVGNERAWSGCPCS